MEVGAGKGVFLWRQWNYIYACTLALHYTVKEGNTQLTSTASQHVPFAVLLERRSSYWLATTVARLLDACKSNAATRSCDRLLWTTCYVVNQISKWRCMLLLDTFHDLTSKFSPSILTVRLFSCAACSEQSTCLHFAVEDKKVLGAFAKLRQTTFSFGTSFLSDTSPLCADQYIHLFIIQSWYRLCCAWLNK